MRKIAFFLAAVICLLLNSRLSCAQMVGSNIYLPGHYLEIGQNNLGTFGAPTPPAGYYPYPAGPLASVYDFGHDGWTVGSPAYFGDFTWPGSNYDGWGIQVNSSTGLNWAIAGVGSITGPGSLTGNNVSYSNSGGQFIANWAGTTAAGQLTINMQTILDTNASSVVVTVHIYNTGTTALDNIYYLRTCDPNNDETRGGTTQTNNTITYQNDSEHRVQVSSTGTVFTDAYLALGTKDNRAESFIEPYWPVNSYVTDLSTLYTGTSGTTSSYVVGTSNIGDYAIGLIYNIGTIAAGDSSVLSYAYIYNGVAGIDSAFPNSCTGTPLAGSITGNILTACTTTTVTLTDTGSTANYYQWQSSPDSTAWSDISGATSVNFTFSGLSATTYYRCIAICAVGGASAITSGIKINYTTSCPCLLYSAGTVTPDIPFACSTATVTLTDTDYNVASLVSLQWQSSPDSVTWASIAGATSSSYSFTGLIANTYYRLMLICTSGADTIKSAGIEMPYDTICICTETPDAGTATASTTSCSSCSITLNLTGSSVADSLKYQWQSSATGTAPWANITGATTIPYTFTPYGTYYYRCRVTCIISGDSAWSSPVEVFYDYHIIAHSTGISPDTVCIGANFYIEINGVSPLLSVKTYFGDGSTDSTALTSATTTADTNIAHIYICPGTYTVKQVVYWNNIPKDSVTFSNEYLSCSTLPILFYLDLNNDCTKENTEPYNSIPTLVQVDSNGVPIDTISVTSGLYYPAFGLPGTVYSFSIISSIYTASCSSGAFLRDTIVATVNTYPAKYYGLICTDSAFDLNVYDVIPVTGIHDEWGNVYISNSHSSPINAMVTVHYNKQYDVEETTWGYLDVTPAPASYTDSTITWNVTGLSNLSGEVDLYYAIWTNLAGPYISPGVVVQTYATITPYVGDVDTNNNDCQIWDTVRASCDPNEMSVSPAGCIATDTVTQLQYTINFMNVGNDTAFNIYVMDTLPANVNLNSLKIVMASTTMNIALLNDGVNNIAKFDFPAINLLDSTECPQCNGAIIFNVNTLPGLPEGTKIFNHAGVFFDDNPVVMTNTVENIMGGCSATSVKNTRSATDNVSIFPNPSNNELSIIMSPGAYSSFTITNNIGQQIIQQPLNQPQTQVNVATLPPGLYYITFKGNNGTIVQKFVKL